MKKKTWLICQKTWLIVEICDHGLGDHHELEDRRGANGRDGLLDLCTFEHGSLGRGLRYLSGLFAGDCGSWDDCQRKRIRKIRLESEQPVPVQLDGDPAGFLPLDIEILPQRLTVLASPAWAAKNGFPKTPELR